MLTFFLSNSKSAGLDCSRCHLTLLPGPNLKYEVPHGVGMSVLSNNYIHIRCRIPIIALAPSTALSH